VCILFDQWFFN